MKDEKSFVSWLRSKLGMDESATVSEIQQSLIDEEPTAQTAPAVDKTADELAVANQTIAVLQQSIAAQADKLATVETALQTANARIAELEAEPAATHTNGADETDTTPRASQDPELKELGNILKNALRAVR